MKEIWSPMSRFWSLLRPFRPEISQIYLYAILNGLVNLSLPLGIQAIINLIQSGEVTTSWVVLVIFVLVGILITGIFQILQLRLVENIQQDIFARSGLEFAYRLPKIKLLQLDRIHAPELVNRFFDTLTIQKGLPKILIDFSLAAFQVVFGLMLLAIYSSYFVILGLVLFFLLWVIYKLTAKRGLDTSLKESKYKYQLAHWLEEVARTNRSFKLNASCELHLQKADSISVNYINAREGHFKVLLQQFQYFIGFRVFVAAGLLILGSVLVFEQQMNIGQFVAAEIVIILILNSIEKIIRSIDTIYDVLTGLEKIGYVTDLELDEQHGMDLSKIRKGVHIEGLSINFGFPDMKQKLIKELSFEINSGEKVVITGESGSGKTTLLHIIGGLYNVDEGEILFDGIPIHNLKKTNLYQNIGFYFPNNQLFEGTIWENITMGKKISDEKVLDVINNMGLKPFIASQLNGVQGKIDPEGRRLPRGIIQKLLIARAILGEPKLLIMEDPLRHIHSEEKDRIVDYIMSDERPWTVIMVGNHPYWQAACSRVIRLERNY